jgi:sugar lactone lactonase YvrE
MRKSRILGGIAVLLALGGALPAGAAGPTLTFQKMIGDLRGRFLPNDLQSVAVDDSGACYAMSNGGTVAVFDPTGSYLRTAQVTGQYPWTYRYLCAVGARVFFGDAGKDFPWLFSPERVGTDPGRFQQPTMATLDPTGTQVYMADTGNNRVQRFAVDQTETPNLVLALDTPPTVVAARGQTLAVISGGDRTLSIYDLSANPPALLATRKLDSGARSVALAPNGTVIVAYAYGQVLRYTCANGALTDAGVLARAAMDDWPRFFPVGTPMVTAPDGQIWFATDVYGKLLSLDPATDTVTDHGSSPVRALCLGFGPNGLLYAGGYPSAGETGPSLAVAQLPALTKVGALPVTGSLYKGDGLPVWGILPDDDGGVYVRVLEKDDWTALTLKKVYPDGTVKPWLDFGQMYAKRTTFHPSAAYYALEFDAEHNILLTAFPLESVMKVTPDGKTLWEAGVVPQGGADRIEFREPRDLAQDSAGNIWVVDSGTKMLYCVSPQGKLLYTFGGPGGIDDLTGQSFGVPTGVAITTVEGNEYLYVGDAGNDRLLKYQLDLP